MITESVSIIAITVCIILVFLRAKRAGYAISVIPLLLVPSMHLLVTGVLFATRSVHYPLPGVVMLAFADIAALAVSCALVVLLSSRIKSKKNKQLYVLLTIGYNVILTCAYVYQTLETYRV